MAKHNSDIAGRSTQSGMQISCVCEPIICSWTPARRPAATLVVSPQRFSGRFVPSCTRSGSFARFEGADDEIIPSGRTSPAAKYFRAKQKSSLSAAGSIGLAQQIPRDKCVTKIDLNQIHGAQALIDLQVALPDYGPPTPR